MSREWLQFNRVAPLELAGDGDGRTLIGRIVPYNVTAVVADPPHFTPYRESFAPGAFRAQLNAADRMLLNYEHRQGISDVVGRGVALEDQPDGLYGSFRVLDHADGDKALELVNQGILRGLSTEFSVPAGGSRTVDGVVQRVNARIGNVALCRDSESPLAGPKAAYKGAEVLAVRTEETTSASTGDVAITYRAAAGGVSTTYEAVVGDRGAEVFIPDAPVSNPDLMARLAALGVTPILARAVTRKPWDGSPARFTDEEYQRSCLIDRGGDGPVKERCSLPVLEPNGDLNVNALGAAAGRIRQVAGVSPAQKAAAARKLVRYYRMAEMTPPSGITMMAAA